jgi:hypothetical protein
MHQTSVQKTLADTLAAIAALDLEPIKFKVTCAEDGYGWTPEYADQVEVAYKRYLTLVAKYPDYTLAPTRDIDQFWHAHILDTRKYAEDCAEVFGFFLHHFPYLGLRGEDDAKAQDAASDAMHRLYAHEFGEPLVAGKAYCGATQEAAYCGAAKEAAYCGAAKEATAYCGAAKEAAYCGVAKQATAYCGAAKPAQAYCGVAQAKQAYCGAAVQAKPAQAYCGAAVQAQPTKAYCGAAVQAQPAKAYCGAAGQAQAYCGAPAAQADAKAYCGAAGQAAYCGAAADARNIDTTQRPRLRRVV